MIIIDINKKIYNFIYSYFLIEEHHSSLKTEIIAGITNYFTMIYLVMLVPETLINAFPGAMSVKGNLIPSYILSNGLTVSQMIVALTAASFAVAGIGTIIMGFVINIPFVLGPSLSIGTFVAYTICRDFGYNFNEALAMIFISGILFFLLAILGIEYKIHTSIPKNLKFAVTAGIGLFVAYTGIKKAYIVRFNDNMLFNLFDITDISSLYTREALLAIATVMLSAIFLKKRYHSAIFIGKFICIILAFPLGLINMVDLEKLSLNTYISHTFLQMDFGGLIMPKNDKSIFISVVTVVFLLIAICIMDIFETMGTILATKSFVKISKEGKVKKRIPKILELDAVASVLGAVMGSTTVSTYVESTAGVIEGGRTGLTAVVTGILFLFSVFISPLASIIPSAATGSTLIIAGIMMMNVIKHIDFEDPSEAVPAFLAMFLMPITNNLLSGITFGVISYVIIQVFIGNAKKINVTMYLLTFFFTVILFFLPH